MTVTPGFFAGTDVVGRIEAAERTLIEEGARAARARAPHEPVISLPIGGGSAVWAGPGSPLNKVVATGLGADWDEGELVAVEKAFAERNSPVQFEVSTAADPAVVNHLSNRGYVTIGFENVLGIPLTQARTTAPAVDGIAIEPVAPEDFDTWVQVVVDGFATPDTQGVASHEEFPREVVERAERDIGATSGFRAVLARSGAGPVGGAGLRLTEGIAQLCGAATLPHHRRRGVQAALLATRLDTARNAGCDLAVVTTLPGSRSQHNVQRLGFQLLYARAILVRPVPDSTTGREDSRGNDGR
ncbi:GNAT family N-acetyltransferase [Nocardia bovistercoris]|uniref:GNAT family N-acetyltransferase n=1 Tax=Nocardia bovistercoris TaxID=2785916 RepID=A0A931N210_9NOCA|nr:GNAT family N-acetyltransferase [Nocardia bovistercoris]MBH0775521.1 GNAT family N-acetyltransferase [Nocardia bovistercoris]